MTEIKQYPELVKILEQMSETQKKKIEGGLLAVKWVIDDTVTMRAVTGGGRIEDVSVMDSVLAL